MFCVVKLALGVNKQTATKIMRLVQRCSLCSKRVAQYLEEALDSTTYRGWQAKCLQAVQGENFEEFLHEPPCKPARCLDDPRPVPEDLLAACLVDRRHTLNGRRSLLPPATTR